MDIALPFPLEWGHAAGEPEPDPPLPLSYGQERLWFLDRLESGTPVYNNPVELRLEGTLHVHSLRRALAEVIRRHEVLRTRYEMADGRPRQVIDTESALEMPMADLRNLAPEKREPELRRLCDREGARPFDLRAGPIMHSRLFRMGEGDHVLFLNVHHIAWDGWSEAVLIRELGKLYDAYSRGEDSPLPELPIQYADYATWQREHLETTDQLKYWRKQLEGAPALLELPSAQPRPAVQSVRGGAEVITLRPDLVRQLKSLSQAEGVSLFMTLLAGFQVLLSRHTGREDIIVGSPIAGRTRTELEGLIGFFVNTLVLRGNLAGNPTFRDLLKRVREMTLGAYAHQELPFETLVKDLRPERNLCYNPLCQVMFVLQNIPAPERQFGDLTIKMAPVSPASAQYDLSLYLREQPGGMTATIEYRVDMYDAQAVRRLLDSYEVLLEGIVAAPSRRISSLPLLPVREKHRILEEWNDTLTDTARHHCLHDLFEAQAASTPDATALVFEDKSLTYGELDARSNQLARHLRKLGVGRESLVAVCAERSIEMVVGLLGILKAGGAYVPLDPEYPRQRLAFMLEDSGVEVLLTQGRSVQSLPESSVRLVRLDADWAEIASENSSHFESGASATDAAYMIYTSGSTGQPKGVINNHEGIVNRLLWMRDKYPNVPGERVLQKTPFSFDVSVWEFFWPLITGATLVVSRPGGHQDATYIARIISDEKITAAHFVPSMLEIFLEQEELRATCKTLKRVFCSGEALPLEMTRRFHARLDAELHNLYGPTEAAVEVTYWASTRDNTLNCVPIGRPVANTRIYILDAELQPVPVMVAGELHIGGVQVARGYHRRPELTAEKFIPDPHSGDPTARLYKTGDLARFLPDGNVEYLGRVDHQVKIRGLRVELGEIEEVLNAHPGVRASVVVAREDVPGDKRLTAYLVSRNGAIKHADLREHMRVKLPTYMIPAAFVALDSLPLTPSGKVDRHALPKPDLDAAADKTMYVPPGTETETLLAGICGEVLGVKRVGTLDDFFELGGHSMLAVQYVARINNALGLKLRISTLFQNPTIEKLARVIDEGNAEKRELERILCNEAAAPVITVQAKGNLTPLFFLHGDWSGGGVYCGRLSRQMGEDRPFHALPPHRAGEQSVLTVEEMARHHVAAIKEHTPRGPYIIGGYCIGATVAMEVARHLAAHGDEVSRLLMIDPPAPHARSESLRRIWPLFDKMGQLLKWDLHKKLSHFYWYDRWRIKSVGRKLKGLTRRFVRKSRITSLLRSGEIEEIRSHVDPVYKMNLWVFHFAQCLYSFKEFCVPTTIYFPEESPSALHAWEMRARQSATPMGLEMVPGDHETCVSKHAGPLGDKIRKTLSGLSAKSGSQN
jgi:amino acid adenylation domain-containing protein